MNVTTLTKRTSSVFYGYVIVAVAFLITAATAGAIFSFGVFFAPLQAEFGWSRAVVSAAFSMHMLSQALLAVAVGRLNDRFGPRMILTVAGLLLGTGFMLISRIDAVWQLYLLYGVLIGSGITGGPVPLMSTVARWFHARRGMMTGIVMAGVGIGTMIMPPVADWMINTLGWRWSIRAVGLFLIATVPLMAQLLRRDPAQMRLLPFRSPASPEQTSPGAFAAGIPFSQAIRTKQLWLLVICFAAFGFGVHSIVVHVVVYGSGLGLSTSSAAGLMTATGASGMIGRIGVGSLADSHGSRRLLVSQYALLAASLFLLAVTRHAWSIYAAALLFGLAFGGVVPLNSHIVAELFGLRAHGAILGVTGVAISLGSAAGPLFTGHCYDVLHSYTVPFTVCGALAALATILAALIRPLPVEPQTGPE